MSVLSWVFSLDLKVRLSLLFCILLSKQEGVVIAFLELDYLVDSSLSVISNGRISFFNSADWKLYFFLNSGIVLLVICCR